MWITGAGVGLDFSRTTHSFQNKPYPVSQIVFVRTGEIMITLGLSIDTAVAWGKVIRENPAFCFEQLSGAGKNIFNQFHHFSAISYLPLFSSFAFFFYFCFFYLLLFMFDIFVVTRVRTVVQIPVHISTPQQTILLSISRLFLLYYEVHYNMLNYTDSF